MCVLTAAAYLKDDLQMSCGGLTGAVQRNWVSGQRDLTHTEVVVQRTGLPAGPLRAYTSVLQFFVQFLGGNVECCSSQIHMTEPFGLGHLDGRNSSV